MKIILNNGREFNITNFSEIISLSENGSLDTRIVFDILDSVSISDLVNAFTESSTSKFSIESLSQTYAYTDKRLSSIDYSVKDAYTSKTIVLK